MLDEQRFPGRQGRILFAFLAAQKGRPVPRDELAELLWGDELPATWEKALRVLMTKLRALLEECGIDGSTALTSAFGCYKLTLPAEAWIDIDAAEDAVERAEAALVRGALDQARSHATVAAALARRSFLPGEDGSWVEAKRRDLRDVLVRSLECLRDASFGAGEFTESVRHAEEVTELEPFRESSYRRLMQAHAAAGNPAEALRVYERCRRFLADELGAYPSSETESIYRELLEAPSAHAGAVLAAELLPADAASRGELESEREGARGWASRKGVWAAAVIVALTAAAIAAFAMRGSHALPASANSVGVVDSGSGRLVADVGVGATPTHIAVNEAAYWVTNADADTVSRIDPATRSVVQTIDVGSSPSGITAGKGAVWVTNSLDGNVSRIDPAINRVVQTLDVGNGPVGIAHAAGSIWVANTGDGTITRIDAVSGEPTKTLPIDATELAFGAGTLWASQRTSNRVVRIDPTTGSIVQAIQVGNGPTAIAFGSGAAWVANSLDGTVSRIDPATDSVAATIPAGDGPTAIAIGADAVWVSNQFDGTLARIDPRTNQRVRRTSVGNRPQGVAVAGGDVLVSIRESGAGHRGGTLRMRMERPPQSNPIDSIDTAVAYATTSWPILRMTGDGLVAFNQASGLAGTQLVPDLAVSLPAPTDGGKRYSFRLRPGIRYSNGRPVEASDFRSTFERDFRIGPRVGYYDVIVGAARCRKTPRRCDLSRGIIADDVAQTITFHLVAPDPEFLYKLAPPFAYVVPSGTPPHDVGTRPLPATGPYKIASYRPRRGLTLVRNPYFHEWSQAAQPDGYPDEIVLQVAGTTDEAIDDVIRGRADMLFLSEPFSQSQLAKLGTRYASHLHTNPGTSTQALFLNTRVAPFDRLDVRRALNYAADRAAALRAAGLPSTAQPTCQILPPNFPGYRPYCPYTARSTARGRWTGPSLTRARALVARSGTRGMRVTVWSWTQAQGYNEFAVKLLRSLGYRASMKVVGDNYVGVVADSRNKAQIGFMGWQADYPAASNFLRVNFGCASFVPGNPRNTNAAEFCDPRIDREMDAALTEQATNPAAARRLWQRVEREIVDQAPWVPLHNFRHVDVLSKRVGNYQYSPAGFGALIDQLWVR